MFSYNRMCSLTIECVPRSKHKGGAGRRSVIWERERESKRERETAEEVGGDRIERASEIR